MAITYTLLFLVAKEVVQVSNLSVFSTSACILTCLLLGAAGLGGGVVNITTPALSVIGTLSANGGGGSPGGAGGSGGSIFVQTTSLTGSGKISTNGGAGANYGNDGGGAGGGGRIAVHTSSSTFTGAYSSTGGRGVVGGTDGGAGTVVLVDINTGRKSLIIANGGNDIYTTEVADPRNARGSITWLTDPTNSFEFDSVILRGNGNLGLYPGVGGAVS